MNGQQFLTPTEQVTAGHGNQYAQTLTAANQLLLNAVSLSY